MSAFRPAPPRPPLRRSSLFLLLLRLSLPANAFIMSCRETGSAPASPSPLIVRAAPSSVAGLHARKSLFTQAGSVLLGASVLGKAPRKAQAWCGKPYPPWAYRLRFNDGLIPVSLPGMPAPADLFLRVVGDEQKEKDQGLAPILLVPGGPGLAHDYTETLEALVYGDRRVVSFDPVGTGQSSRSLPPALADGPPGGAETAEWKHAWSALLQEQLREILRFLEIDSHHVWAQGAACLPALQHTAAFAPPSSAPSSPSPSPSALARGVKSLTLADPFVFAPGARSLPSLYSDRGAAVPLCVTESVAGVKGGGEGGREDRVHYERQWEGLPELGKVGNRPIFLSYGSTGEGEGSLDEVAVGRLRSRVEEGGREGGVGGGRVVVKKFGSRLPHVDEPEAYVDWLDELLQGTEKMRPA